MNAVAPMSDTKPLQIWHDGSMPEIELLAQVQRALVARFPDTFWACGDQLVRLNGDKLTPMNADTLGSWVAKAVTLVKRGRGGLPIHMGVSREHRIFLCKSPHQHGFPELKGVVHCPYLTPSKRLVVKPGYDGETGLWLAWEGEPVAPDGVDPDTIEDVLQRLLDSPFESAADKTHAFGLLLLPILRAAINGPTPLHLISAKHKGAGKTYLAELVGLIATGEVSPVLSYSSWGPEAERLLGGYLAGSPTITLIDNLPTGGLVGGSIMHAYLTATGPVHIRPVRSSLVEVLIRCIWMATINNPQIDSEQTRRTVQIRIQKVHNYPYKTPDLRGWIVENRTTVLSVLCALVQTWVNEGCPKASRRLPSFEAWSDVVGGVLGKRARDTNTPDLFLAAEARPAAAEPEWQELARIWPAPGGQRSYLPTAQIEMLIDDNNLTAFQEELNTANGSKGRQTKLGRMLNSAVHNPDMTPEVQIQKRNLGNVARYCISLPNPPADDGEPVPPWKRELDKVGERGVAVDGHAWESAVLDYRERLHEEPDVARQADRLKTLAGYAEQVALQAKSGDGRVRADWAETSWTGRLSARRPPLQTITKEGDLRAAVVPGPGHRFVVADWSCSHLRIAAGLSKDAGLIAALAPGQDLHQATGDRVARGHPQARTLGKTLNLAALNLSGAARIVKIAAERGVALNEAEAADLLVRWWDAYPDLRRWRKELCRNLPTSWTTPVMGREICVPPNKHRPTKVLAGFLQSLEADALCWVLERSPQVMAGLRAEIVLLVHDAVVWEVPVETADVCAARAQALMKDALGLVCTPAPPAASVEVRENWASPR